MDQDTQVLKAMMTSLYTRPFAAACGNKQGEKLPRKGPFGCFSRIADICLPGPPPTPCHTFLQMHRWIKAKSPLQLMPKCAKNGALDNSRTITSTLKTKLGYLERIQGETFQKDLFSNHTSSRRKAMMLMACSSQSNPESWWHLEVQHFLKGLCHNQTYRLLWCHGFFVAMSFFLFLRRGILMASWLPFFFFLSRGVPAPCRLGRL